MVNGISTKGGRDPSYRRRAEPDEVADDAERRRDCTAISYVRRRTGRGGLGWTRRGIGGHEEGFRVPAACRGMSGARLDHAGRQTARPTALDGRLLGQARPGE